MIELMTAAGLSSEPQAGQQKHTQEPNKIFRFIVGLWPLAPYFFVCVVLSCPIRSTKLYGLLVVASCCSCCCCSISAERHPLWWHELYDDCRARASSIIHRELCGGEGGTGGDLRIHKGPISCERRWTTSGSTFPSQWRWLPVHFCPWVLRVLFAPSFRSISITTTPKNKK